MIRKFGLFSRFAKIFLNRKKNPTSTLKKWDILITFRIGNQSFFKLGIFGFTFKMGNRCIFSSKQIHWNVVLGNVIKMAIRIKNGFTKFIVFPKKPVYLFRDLFDSFHFFWGFLFLSGWATKISSSRIPGVTAPLAWGDWGVV